MKKILITLTALLLTHNAFADNKYYIKPSVGFSNFNNVAEKGDTFNISQKTKMSLNGNIALGYYINENIRTDIAIGYDEVNFKDGFYRYKVREFVAEGIDYYAAKPSLTTERSANIPSIMLNGYYDIPVNEFLNFFVGGGIGIARIDEKIEGITKFGDKTISTINSHNKTTNFAYNVSLGASYKLSDTSKLDVHYNWKDFGKTKSKEYMLGKKTTKVHYRGHSATVGVRFDV